MTDEKETKKDLIKTDGDKASVSDKVGEKKTENDGKPNDKKRMPRKQFRKNPRRKPRRARVKSEFDHRVADIRRVTRVVAGGRRFSFSVVVVAGDRRGRVGVGIGKAGDTALAIDKAVRDAKKKMLTISLTKTKSIQHEVGAKYASAVVKIFPAPGKGGLTAGSVVRNVLELGGVKNVGAKIHSRTKNKLNIARATIKALEQLPKTETKKESDKKGKDKKEKPRQLASERRGSRPKASGKDE